MVNDMNNEASKVIYTWITKKGVALIHGSTIQMGKYHTIGSIGLTGKYFSITKFD